LKGPREVVEKMREYYKKRSQLYVVWSTRVSRWRHEGLGRRNGGVKAIKACTGALVYFPGDIRYEKAGTPVNLSSLSGDSGDIVKLIGTKESCEKAEQYIQV
jgi:hypothetical protein